MSSSSNPTISEPSISAPRAESSDRLSAAVSLARAFTSAGSGEREAIREAILGVWGVPPEKIT